MRLSEKELPYRSFRVVHPKHFGLWSLFWTHDPFSAVFKSSICSVAPIIAALTAISPLWSQIVPQWWSTVSLYCSLLLILACFLILFCIFPSEPKKIPSQCFECHFCAEFARWVFSTKLLQSTWTEKVYSFKHPAVDWTLSSTIRRTLTEVERSVLP